MKMTRMRASGFTLLETLLYLALTTGLVVLVSLTSISLAEYRVHAYERSETLYSASFAQDMIRDTLNQSHSITVPAPGESGEELVFVDANQRDTTLRVVDGTLVIERSGDASILLTTPHTVVSNVTFERTPNSEGAAAVVSYTVVSRVNEHISVQLHETIASRMSL